MNSACNLVSACGLLGSISVNQDASSSHTTKKFLSAGQTAQHFSKISLGMWKKQVMQWKKWWSRKRRKRSENEWFSTGWIFPIWPNRTKTMTDWAKNFFPFFDEMAAKIIAKDPPYQIMRSAPLWNLLTAHRSGQRVAKKCQKLEESLILYMPDRLKTIWPSKQIEKRETIHCVWNSQKSLIQHCERSELGLFFELTKLLNLVNF